VLISPPPYLQPNDDELVAFYAAIARRVDLPICVYNWPPGTNVDMSVELLTRLADIDQIVAIKQSTANLSSFVRTVFELGDRVRVFGYAMDEHGLTLLQARGGDGTMGSAGVLGHFQPDFYNHIWAGRIDQARECGRRDRTILTEWCTPELTGKYGSGPAIMKAALKARGVDCGPVRPPLLDLSPDNAERVAATLRSLGAL
jgi:4-hydroxy-tetrahydrodipicolinate synthase